MHDLLSIDWDEFGTEVAQAGLMTAAIVNLSPEHLATFLADAAADGPAARCLASLSQQAETFREVATWIDRTAQLVGTHAVGACRSGEAAA